MNSLHKYKIDFLDTITNLSKSKPTDADDKALILDSTELIDLDGISQKLYQKAHGVTVKTVDALAFHENCIELIEFKDAKLSSLDKEDMKLSITLKFFQSIFCVLKELVTEQEFNSMMKALCKIKYTLVLSYRDGGNITTALGERERIGAQILSPAEKESVLGEKVIGNKNFTKNNPLSSFEVKVSENFKNKEIPSLKAKLCKSNLWNGSPNLNDPYTYDIKEKIGNFTLRKISSEIKIKGNLFKYLGETGVLSLKNEKKSSLYVDSTGKNLKTIEEIIKKIVKPKKNVTYQKLNSKILNALKKHETVDIYVTLTSKIRADNVKTDIINTKNPKWLPL